jgi:MoaA/NifB/PqqE/SkfB family radical SAM enzyme
MAHNLALLVTTHCNRQCPDCCLQIPKHVTMVPQHQPWEYFEDAARHFDDIFWLYVAGGEPTLHPEFPRIAREFRSMFEPERLLLTTNGARLVEQADSIKYFDEIRITDFDDPRSQAAIAWMRQHAPDKLVVWGAEHTPITHRGGPCPCGRQTIAAYALGRVYPCCEAPGLPQAASIPLGPGWEAALAKLPLPCADCPFGVAQMPPLAVGVVAL